MPDTDRDINAKETRINLPLFLITGGFIAVFCLTAFIDLDALSAAVDWSFDLAATYFGLYWQILLLANFLIAIALCALPGSRAKLGNRETPEFGTFQWGCMIMCTLLGAGGVFWAAGEPIAHFMSAPPVFGVPSGAPETVGPALAQAFMHWGFLGWAILGALSTIMLMYYHYEKGLPLAPRTLLYPVFGDKAINGPIGLIADAACIIAVVAGTVGPIGFLGLQVSYGLSDLFGIPDVFATQFAVIAALMALYTISALTGLSRGIQVLSQLNVILAGCLLVFLLVFGPTSFIFSAFFSGYGTYLGNFFQMALYRGDAGLFGDPGWLSPWTLFFWAWFIVYGPLMAIFIARVSRGRSIRSIILMLSIVAPVVSNFWFTMVGGTGIAAELADPGTISSAFEGFNLPAALLAITQTLPMGFVISLLFLILTTIFVATTGDSMSYVVASLMSRDSDPPAAMRVFWGVAMGIMAIILVSVGSGSVSKLQSFIVVTAVPASLVLLPSLWDAVRITWLKGKSV
ncbi:BCCT family transporter [Rhodobacteraceae bacterium]|nr:BCCT family transporter [Paracoccaceae bacterium]